MKRLIILITITLSAISISKAQSEMRINMNDLQAEISSELAKLPAIHIDIEAMRMEMDGNLANLENMPILVDLSSTLNNLSNLENLNLKNITVSSYQPGIHIAVNDTNTPSVYAYTESENTKSENSFTYSYTTNETPQNSDALFSNLSNIKGVEIVYISKSMLGMMPNMNMPGVDIGNIAGKLESLEIYSSEEGAASKRLTTATEGLLKGGDYETLMLIKDNDSKTAFYMKKHKSNQASEMLMITEDGADATIIRFLGTFSIQDIKNIANQGKNTNVNTNINTSSTKLSEEELNQRIKEAQKRNEEVQKIAQDAQQRAIEAQKRAEEQASRAEERARRAEERAKEAERKAQKAN